MGLIHTSVDFKSDLFKPCLPEDSQVNPQTYGAELSYWLCQQLAIKNMITSYPNSEDWGWFIEYFVDDNEYLLGCSNSDAIGEAWRCFLRPQANNFFARNKAPLLLAQPLLQTLQVLLEETQGISHIRWSNDYDL